MSPVPDRLLWRRVADLERKVAQLEQLLALSAGSKAVTPLNARLWRATLNEAFGATTSLSAGADLLSLGGTDTGLDITLYDPLSVFVDLAGTEGLYVAEQIDMDGTRRFIPLQCPCPP
jgi:hypothetical protein